MYKIHICSTCPVAIIIKGKGAMSGWEDSGGVAVNKERESDVNIVLIHELLKKTKPQRPFHKATQRVCVPPTRIFQ